MAAMSKENERRSADFRQSTGACARAISRDASISLNFDDEAVDVDVDAAALPDIPADATPEERIRLRGRSDAIALHRQHHDAASHARLSYSNDVSNRCFGMAEQTRVELLGSKIFKGVEAKIKKSWVWSTHSLCICGSNSVVRYHKPVNKLWVNGANGWIRKLRLP